MYAAQINYRQAVERWCKKVDEYNAQCPTIVTERTVKTVDGEVTKKYERKVGTVKASVKATGLHLIAQYAEAWAKYTATTRGLGKPSDVYLKTNRVEIGERLNRSPRSVYDHIRKLIAVGLVDNYKFCGRHQSFELWISPQILFGEGNEEKKETPLKAPKMAVSLSVRQNLPPSHITQKQHSTTIGAVDCGKTGKQNQGDNENPHRGGQIANQPAPYEPRAKETRKGGGAAPAGADAYAELERGFVKLPKFLRQMVVNFWFVARASLYHRNEWSTEENQMALLEIYSGVFGKFGVTQSDAAWTDYYNELIERLTMAQTWFSKHEKRYPDKPYASQKKMGYFDAKNNFGFAMTAAWLAKDQLRKRENRVEYLLNVARLDFERLAAGKPRASKQEMSELQLFVYYNNLAKSYGKEVQERFSAQYLAQKARNFAPVKVAKMSIRAQKAAAKAEVVYVEPWMEMGESFIRY